MKNIFIGECAVKLRKLLDKKAEPIARKYGIRTIELEILLFLYHSPCADTAKDIVAGKAFSKSHISKSLDNLHLKGFVELVEDERDRRKKHIVLTPKAEEAAAELLTVHNACKQCILSDITEEEQVILASVIKKIHDRLDAELQG